MTLLIAVLVNLTLLGALLLLAARRDLDDQPIGTGGWVLMVVLLGPVGFLLFLLVTHRAPRLPSRGMKRCPECAEDVKAQAAVCRFCGHQFEHL